MSGNVSNVIMASKPSNVCKVIDLCTAKKAVKRLYNL
jgi:hypothetical protein